MLYKSAKFGAYNGTTFTQDILQIDLLRYCFDFEMSETVMMKMGIQRDVVTSHTVPDSPIKLGINVHGSDHVSNVL